MSDIPKLRIAAGGTISSRGAERLARCLAQKTEFPVCCYEILDPDLEAIPLDESFEQERIEFFQHAIASAITAHHPLGITLSDPEEYYFEQGYQPNDRRGLDHVIECLADLGLTYRIITPSGTDIAGFIYETEVSLHGPLTNTTGRVYAGAAGCPVVWVKEHLLNEPVQLMNEAQHAWHICRWELPRLELVG
jgi:hypothetical protein